MVAVECSALCPHSHSLNPAIQCRNLLEPGSLLSCRNQRQQITTCVIPIANAFARLLFGDSQKSIADDGALRVGIPLHLTRSPHPACFTPHRSRQALLLTREMATPPPLSPIRDYITPIDTSPTNSHREQLRRRNSSFSSNHDRSPVTPRSRHRSSINSNFSQHSAEPANGTGGGGGNLADELDFLSDEEEFEEGTTEDAVYSADKQHEAQEQTDSGEGARDSGIDVSYSSKRSSPKHIRNFSKPFAQSEKPPDETEEDELEERLSPELEDCISAVHRMAQYSDATADPLIPRVVSLMQDLGNQSGLESGAQRLNTSTNSMSTHLGKEMKALQTLNASLYSPFIFSAPLDLDSVEASLPLIEALLASLPRPDTAPLIGLQKLGRETEATVQALAGLTDTLQMGKQTTNAASRHLRTTQTMVADLRRERERSEAAREELLKSPWESKIKDRWCKSECQDVVSGFDDVCKSLRESLAQSVEATSA